MIAEQIHAAICESLARVARTPPERIHGAASYRDDLGLDSLSMLEVTVDLEYAFKVKIPEERLQEIRTVDDSIRLVQEYLPRTT